MKGGTNIWKKRSKISLKKLSLQNIKIKKLNLRDPSLRKKKGIPSPKQKLTTHNINPSQVKWRVLTLSVTFVTSFYISNNQFPNYFPCIYKIPTTTRQPHAIPTANEPDLIARAHTEPTTPDRPLLISS